MSTLKVDTIKHSDGTDTTEPSIPALDTRMASAWVHIYGANVPAGLADAYNVSSITDNGVGHYTVNFTVALANTKYAPVVTRNDTNDATIRSGGFSSAQTTSSLVVYMKSGSTMSDGDLCVHIFGGK